MIVNLITGDIYRRYVRNFTKFVKTLDGFLNIIFGRQAARGRSLMAFILYFVSWTKGSVLSVDVSI